MRPTLSGHVAAAGFDSYLKLDEICCARVPEVTLPPLHGKADQWVTVTGTFEPGGGELPRIRATTVEGIEAPNDPYE
jgi:hypothetical protein